MGEHIRIAKPEVDIKPLVFIQVKIKNYNKGDRCLEGIEYFHFISVILQGFWGWNPKYRRGNVKRVRWV